MKRSILLIVLVVLQLSLHAQDWLPVGNGTNNGGNGGVTLRAYNGKLIAGGAFSQAGNVNAKGVAMWDGSDWSVVDSSMNSFFAVRPLVVFRGQLYGFVSQFGDPSGYMLRLDSNFRWHYVPNSDHYKGMYQGGVYSAAVYNDELYIAGRFDSIGGVLANNIARWDGMNWMPAGSGIDNVYILAMTVFGNELYAGGYFGLAGGVAVNNLAKWDGSVWHDVGGGLTGGGTYKLRTMEVYQDELYIGGDFQYAGGQLMDHITKWNGTAFSNVGGGFPVGDSPDAFKVFGNRLIMSSGFFPYHAGAWDGIHFDSLGTGLNAGPTDFEVYDCQLYAGGRFNMSGTGVAKGVAVLDTIDCSVDVNEAQMPISTLSIYPNPFVSQTTVSFGKPQKAIRVSITDALGREVRAMCFSGSELVVERGNLVAGVYFIKVEDGGRGSMTRRVVVL